MRKELKDGTQSEMVREKSNFKRAAIHLQYFREKKGFTTTGPSCLCQAWVERGVYFERQARKARNFLLLSILFSITHKRAT